VTPKMQDCNSFHWTMHR